MTSNERVYDATLHAWITDCAGLIEGGVATDSAAVCPLALRRASQELLDRRAAETPQSASQKLVDLALVKKLKKLVGGWGEPRHPMATPCSPELACGDIYEFIDAVRSSAETLQQSSNEQSLFLVTTVSAAGEDGFVGRLYLTAEQAKASAAVNELAQPVVIRDAVETSSPTSQTRCPHGRVVHAYWHCDDCGEGGPAEKTSEHLGAETSAATSRGARSTEDAGRPQPYEKTDGLCPHGFVLADNICGPCSEGRPNRSAEKAGENHGS